MDLKGKVAIVTGSSRGLGKAMALTFARSGAKVAIIGRTEEPHPRIAGTIHQTVAEVQVLGGTALPVRCNVASPEDIETMAKQVLQAYGRVDVVVHNAAANFPGGVADTEARRWDILMDVNVRALFLLAKAVLPAMKAQGSGHILSVSPKPSLDNSGGPYIQSKQATTRLALSMAEEFKGWGIAVNCLWPDGLRRTEGTTLMGMSAPQVYDPQIFADAAYAVVTKDPKAYTGRALLDTEALRAEGVKDFSKYLLPPQKGPRG